MFILRKLLKLLLMPVVFILFFTKWALETSIHLTGGIVGLFIGGNIIYSIIVHSWTDTFLCSLIFAGIMAILMAVVVVQDFCDSIIQKIGML